MAEFASLTGSERDVAYFRKGFLSPCLPSYPRQIGDFPQGAEDVLYWQFPARTEAQAYQNHSAMTEVPASNGQLHCYLGLPWATFIDKKYTDGLQLQVARVRLSGFRYALWDLGVSLRLHTVCQHIYWRKMVPIWQSLGVTDIWLSHLPAEGLPHGDNVPFEVHPWSLFATNIEDPARREGIVEGKAPSKKRYLASFIGTHLGHYLSDVRLRLRALAGEPGFLIRVTQDKWHFEGVVYRHQVGNEPLSSVYRIDDTVAEYNRILSDSVFALCPSGAGPNTLRLWEALAVGAVPVLMGPEPMLPSGGSLGTIDWERIVLRVTNEQIGDLPGMLRRIPVDEIRTRQILGMEAYLKVREQRCF